MCVAFAGAVHAVYVDVVRPLVDFELRAVVREALLTLVVLGHLVALDAGLTEVVSHEERVQVGELVQRRVRESDICRALCHRGRGPTDKGIGSKVYKIV